LLDVRLLRSLEVDRSLGPRRMCPRYPPTGRHSADRQSRLRGHCLMCACCARLRSIDRLDLGACAPDTPQRGATQRTGKAGSAGIA